MRASTLTMLSEICGLLNVPSFSFKKQLTVGCIGVCQAQFLNQMCTPSRSHFSALQNRLRFTQKAWSKIEGWIDVLSCLFIYLRIHWKHQNESDPCVLSASYFILPMSLYFLVTVGWKNNTCFPAPSLNCGRWLERQHAFALFCFLWK